MARETKGSGTPSPQGMAETLLRLRDHFEPKTEAAGSGVSEAVIQGSVVRAEYVERTMRFWLITKPEIENPFDDEWLSKCLILSLRILSIWSHRVSRELRTIEHHNRYGSVSGLLGWRLRFHHSCVLLWCWYLGNDQKEQHNARHEIGK